MSQRLTMLQEGKNEFPEDPFYPYAIALEFLQSDSKKGLKLLQECISQFPSYLPSYYITGQELEKEGSNEKAEEVYQAGIQLAKQQNNTKATGELSTALMLLDDDWD